MKTSQKPLFGPERRGPFARYRPLYRFEPDPSDRGRPPGSQARADARTRRPGTCSKSSWRLCVLNPPRRVGVESEAPRTGRSGCAGPRFTGARPFRSFSGMDLPAEARVRSPEPFWTRGSGHRNSALGTPSPSSAVHPEPSWGSAQSCDGVNTFPGGIYPPPPCWLWTN